MDTVYLREKLAKLCFQDDDSFNSYHLANQPIFSEEEISDEPLKWLKYLVLDRVGLESINKIALQINRFKLTEIEQAIAWVESRFINFSVPETQKMIVAKVVPWDSGAQLKNYRMFRLNDVKSAFAQIRSDFGEISHELWCCESSVSNEGLNLGGRINYPKGGGKQQVELVWFSSPRLIESFKLPNFPYPYIRASRTFTNPTFDIEVLHIPPNFSAEQKNHLWLEDFQWVLRELEFKQQAMNLLVKTIKTLGAREVCFCFKMVEERLTIIDWDSEVESTDFT